LTIYQAYVNLYSMSVPEINIRSATPDDLPFLKEMCFLAAFPTSKDASEQAFDDAAATETWLTDYIDGWGRDGDHGLIAVSEDGENIGAAWYRKYGKAGLPPYELSMAVRNGSRERGIGKTLLEQLLHDARTNGIPELGLQVEPENGIAHALYHKLGFVSIAEHDGNDVMTATTA
jgi:ribosomal protein S18 acetylase RimI-like enzyme